MSTDTKTFAMLDEENGITLGSNQQNEEMPLPAWYRSIHNVPISELTIADLSRACRQNVHIEAILPCVIERLQENYLAGDLYDGELLVSLGGIHKMYWANHVDHASVVRLIIESVYNGLPKDMRIDAEKIIQKIDQAG